MTAQLRRVNHYFFLCYLAGMKLFHRVAGEGQPLIILHGLFGSSDNWFSLAKVFAEHFKVYLIDQRNHGQSPHSMEFDYKVLTEDLHEFITTHNIEQPIIIGHSMGGKTAMNFAVKYPALVKQLIVVDIMPKKYPVHHDHILEGLQAIDLSSLQSRNEADEALAVHIPEPDVRQFLLKNLSRNTSGGFEWKINLKAIDQNIEAIGDGMVYPGSYTGPTLFINGTRSNYYKSGDEKIAQEIFPNAKWAKLNTGHWVQAEQPKEFSELILTATSH